MLSGFIFQDIEVDAGLDNSIKNSEKSTKE